MAARIIGVVVILLVLAGLYACATRPPAPKQDIVPVVNSEGRMDPHQRATYLVNISAGTDSELVSTTLDDIATLSNTPLYVDNDVQLLIDGPETYASMLEAIESAEHHILLESYIFADDEVGQGFADRLKSRSREGIDVRLIYDAFGSVGSDTAFFQEMESAGIDLIEFNSINPLKNPNPMDLNNRNHRKILVVDGKVAFTGGINLSSTYSTSSALSSRRDPKDTGWRDTHIRVSGPAAVGFQKVFLEYWVENGGQPRPALFEPTEFSSAGKEIVAILAARGGDSERSEIFAAYLSAMAAARERVWITQAYFAPDEEFISLLKQAAQRGVDVRVLVPGVSDSRLALNASRSRYRDLLEAGVEVYERQNALLHAKTAVIDGIWSTVGSSNLDYRSFLHNDEVNAIILGRPFAGLMEEQFRRDIEESRRITQADWNDRSLWSRIKERLSWFVEYWI